MSDTANYALLFVVLVWQFGWYIYAGIRAWERREKVWLAALILLFIFLPLLALPAIGYLLWCNYRDKNANNHFPQ